MDRELSREDAAPREVYWYFTFEFAAALAEVEGIDLVYDRLPLPGTVMWCRLAASDSRKLLALLLGGVREAIGHDAARDALVQAGEAISEAAPWTEIANALLQRARWEDNHPWVKPWRGGHAA